MADTTDWQKKLTTSDHLHDFKNSETFIKEYATAKCKQMCCEVSWPRRAVLLGMKPDT